MKKFLELISEEMGKGFEAAGYEAQLGRVTVSNRPDLCEYQCNGAMAGDVYKRQIVDYFQNSCYSVSITL